MTSPPDDRQSNASETRGSDAAADERLERRLASLGTEGPTERAVKRIVPWVISAALHAGLVILGFIITWTVVTLQEEQDPVLIVADFDATMYEPVVAEQTDPVEAVEPAAPDRTGLDVEVPDLQQEEAWELDPIDLIGESISAPSPGDFAPPLSGDTATFVGLTSTNARRIVYVIDASGSMIASLQVVIDELARSLDGLTPQQSFGIIFFQKNDALAAPPASTLVEATEREKLRALEWIDEHVIPRGRSNPIRAIEKAMQLKPDVIFLLSQDITGSGIFEIDQRDLLGLLDELNPVNPATGRRKTQINCVQFLERDDLGTLRKIAEIHGGPRGYKFLDREELGLAAP